MSTKFITAKCKNFSKRKENSITKALSRAFKSMSDEIEISIVLAGGELFFNCWSFISKICKIRPNLLQLHQRLTKLR